MHLKIHDLIHDLVSYHELSFVTRGTARKYNDSRITLTHAFLMPLSLNPWCSMKMQTRSRDTGRRIGGVIPSNCCFLAMIYEVPHDRRETQFGRWQAYPRCQDFGGLHCDSRSVVGEWRKLPVDGNLQMEWAAVINSLGVVHCGNWIPEARQR
jgi:hypothetical protein